MLVNVSLVGGNFAIVKARTLKQAETWARWEFGNNNVGGAQKATDEDAAWYEAMGGVIHEAESVTIKVGA